MFTRATKKVGFDNQILCDAYWQRANNFEFLYSNLAVELLIYRM